MLNGHLRRDRPVERADIPSSELQKVKRQVQASAGGPEQRRTLQQAMLLGQLRDDRVGERIPEKIACYHYLDTLLDRITEVTVQDVARGVEKYFTEDNRTVGYLIMTPTRWESKRRIEEPVVQISKKTRNAPKLDVERVELPNGLVTAALREPLRFHPSQSTPSWHRVAYESDDKRASPLL